MSAIKEAAGKKPWVRMRETRTSLEEACRQGRMRDPSFPSASPSPSAAAKRCGGSRGSALSAAACTCTIHRRLHMSDLPSQNLCLHDHLCMVGLLRPQQLLRGQFYVGVLRSGCLIMPLPDQAHSPAHTPPG